MNIEAKRQTIKAFIKALGNTIYTVEFTKKSTGEHRVMNCRQGVQKDLKGGTNNLGDKPDVIGTYDQKVAQSLPEDQRGKAYRAIWLDGVTAIRGGGLELTFS